MKFKIYILLLTLLIPGLTMGQVTKERDVVANGGEYSSAPALALSWTVGEVAVTTQQSTALIITEGFQQADSDPVGVTDIAFPAKISIFPNPVYDELNFHVTSEAPLRMSGEVYDLNGKLVQRVPTFQSNRSYRGSIDFSHLPAGKWLLRFTSDKSSLSKDYIVTKVH